MNVTNRANGITVANIRQRLTKTSATLATSQCTRRATAAILLLAPTD